MTAPAKPHYGARSWQMRCVRASDGTQTGSILRAALRLGADAAGRQYGPHGTVTSDGFLLADYRNDESGWHMGAFVGTVEELEENIRRLAIHVGLAQDERRALYDVIQGWVTTDYRDQPGLWIIRRSTP